MGMTKPPCSVDGCEMPHNAKGFCRLHYTRYRRYGTPDDRPVRGQDSDKMALVRANRRARLVECGHPDRQHAAKGMCASCYQISWAKAHPDKGPKAWWAANPERARLLRRKQTLKLYGITPERYDEMWTEQGGKCANTACDFTAERTMTNYTSGLTIDHHHASGRVRGLLCGACNFALGQVNDDVNRLLGLIGYLEAHALT